MTKKIIALLLACLFAFVFSACGGDDVEESSQPSESSNESQESQESQEEGTGYTSWFTSKNAVELIERDRLLTDIFINNSLCEEKKASASIVPDSSEYASFSVIEELLDSTYTKSSESRTQFLSYPENHTPSVSNVNGKTCVFNHIGSSYGDFINPDSVAVHKTDKNTEKRITATTISDKEVELKAVYEDSQWRLEAGIYTVNPPEITPCEEKFPLSMKGSFGAFSGKVLVVELFFSDNKSGFTSEEEKEFHSRIKNACDYMVQESEKYGNDVEVTYVPKWFEHSGECDTDSRDFDIVFAETGFGTLQKFAEVNFDLSQYDNYVFFVCMDKELESSYEVFNGTENAKTYFAERVIIGRNTTDIEMCDSLLKLLGAYGYNDGKCDEYTEALYKKYFPNEISSVNRLADFKMSPVTAYACGISDNLLPLYRVFFYE